jgi:hypothetical protein
MVKMSLTGWIFWGIIALIVLPILIGTLRDRFGSNNRFYGDEANNTKRTKFDEAHEKRVKYDRHAKNNHFGSGGFGGGDGGGGFG